VKLFLLAGEPSGDKLGAALMAGLKTLAPGVEFIGVGGPLMQSQGLASLFPMRELAVMGMAEVLPRIPHLMQRIRQTAQAAVGLGATALITIDSPDFCFRVARRVKTAAPNMRTIHYVAPSVWAWRPGRAKRMAQYIDHVLALLPFEPPHMAAAGMGCDFVGHPVATDPVPGHDEEALFRIEHDINPHAPIIVVLPGSRRNEVSRMMPVFAEALADFVSRFADVRVVVPAVAATAAQVTEGIRRWPGRPVLLDPRGRRPIDVEANKRRAFAAAGVALAASGTVSLELAAAATPMVIAYDMNWFSRRLIGALLKVDTVTLVNLVTNTRAVPEFLGADCRAQPIAAALVRLIEDPVMRSAQIAAERDAMQRLGRGGEAAGLRAARAVMAVL